MSSRVVLSNDLLGVAAADPRSPEEPPELRGGCRRNRGPVSLRPERRAGPYRHAKAGGSGNSASAILSPPGPGYGLIERIGRDIAAVGPLRRGAYIP